MADIELIVKIPKETYKDIIKNGFIYDEDNEVVTYALKNGTPIPDNATNGDLFICTTNILEKIKAEIEEKQKNTIDWSRSVGLIDALEIIDKYAEQEKDAYDKVLSYLKENVDDFPDYHEAIEAVLKMKGGE